MQHQQTAAQYPRAAVAYHSNSDVVYPHVGTNPGMWAPCWPGPQLSEVGHCSQGQCSEGQWEQSELPNSDYSECNNIQTERLPWLGYIPHCSGATSELGHWKPAATTPIDPPSLFMLWHLPPWNPHLGAVCEHCLCSLPCSSHGDTLLLCSTCATILQRKPQAHQCEVCGCPHPSATMVAGPQSRKLQQIIEALEFCLVPRTDAARSAHAGTSHPVVRKR